MTKHNVTGGNDVNLVVHEFGNPKGPEIFLIHGYAQCHLCWQKQIDSVLADEFRLICIDNRGHGESDKPVAPENYSQNDPWADDVHNVIQALQLKNPVLAGWSYGGYIINNYLDEYGQEAIAGINYVAAGAARSDELRHLSKGSVVGTLMPLMLSEDTSEFVEGTRRFLRACFKIQPTDEEFEIALAYNAMVPAKVRAAMFDRQLDGKSALQTLRVPTLVTQGTEDLAIRPAMAEYILSHVAHADASWYDGIGHSPFMEAADRFNNELAAFVRSCN
jgi:pimeloyl-ACP methyl ester carboxylesterase